MSVANSTNSHKDAVASKWRELVAKEQAVAKAEEPNGVPNVSRAPEKLNKTIVLAASTWDAFVPPPTNSFKGKVVPRIMNRYTNRRKLSLEIHKVIPLTEETDANGKKIPVHPYEECVLRFLVPVDKKKEIEARKEGIAKVKHHEGSNKVFGTEDVIDYDIDNESTTETVHLMKKVLSTIADTGGKHFDGWVAKYRFPMKSISVEYQLKTSVHVLIQVDDVKQERELLFDTLDDAKKFCDTLATERKNEEVRAKARLDSALGDLKLPPFEKITLLIEICSGWDLPIGDMKTSDPYVVCLLGSKEVHRTKHISRTLDPIWTVKTGSLFILTIGSEELFITEGMKFLVKDFDKIGGHETLGLVHVPPKSLYLAKGERMEFKLQPVPGKTADEVPGYLSIRCRRASDYDINFMASYESSHKAKKKAIAAPVLPKTSNNAIKSIISKTKKTEHGVKKYKARPCPDPKRPEETEWLTKEEVEVEMMKPSRHWIDSGNGKLGRIFIEVLSAKGLPNLDTGSWLGNLTDSFVSIVYEDTYVRTDTIDDCLNPVWLPWSNRAFILNIGHASSQIFLGVFDFDAGFDDHDLIGRASIDITNLRPDTEYLLNYEIHPSAMVSGRNKEGEIKIRLRLEIPDERKLALSALDPPLPTYVNVKKGKDFRVVRQTCLGKYDVDKYSLNVLKSYVDELSEYQNLLFYIEDAVITLFLWRGHYKITVLGKDVMLPIHSAFAFMLAILLVENPQYYPSFFFACLSWLLVAVMGWRRNSPDEWSRCQSYVEVLEKVIVGKSSTPPHNIKPFEGFDAAQRALERWLKRIQDANEKAERDYKAAQQLEAERQEELAEIGEADADISTKVGTGMTIDPFKAALHPVQLLLGVVCRALRFVKHVVYWEEAYFAFWITTGSAFLSIACLFVPWFFILRWTARIIAWTLFGPWMKLVDVYYVSTLKPESDDERKEREERERMQRRKLATQAANDARLIRENTAKMKEMKKVMFGKFAMRVPILKQDRFSDRPLASSSAKPFEEKALTLAELAMQEAGYNRKRLPGQTLTGDMIPVAETVTFTTAPTGTATAFPEKVAKDAPGGGGKIKPTSTAMAYTKLIAVVVLAAILTFFGVPIIGSTTGYVIGLAKELDFRTEGAAGLINKTHGLLQGLYQPNEEL